MAVDTKQGSTPPPAGSPSPATTLAGIQALNANGMAKRKRPSSLMAQAGALPSVESSLDEFIAKANETLIDPTSFNSEQVRREEDDKRKEHDALRWKATEQQMRVAQEREEALRRQLSGLQGQLAEAEARAAVAGSGGSQDGIIADLKLRLTMADEKIRTSEERVRYGEVKVVKLEQEVAEAHTKASTMMPAVRDSLVGIGDVEADQRVMVAEAKAAKAIAAARAAAAGLTVSPADLNSIENSLSAPPAFTQKKAPVGLIAGISAGAIAIGLLLGFVFFNGKKEATPTAAVAQPAEKQKAADEGDKPEKSAKPTVTPIEDKAAKPADGAIADGAIADKAAADKAAADDKAAAEAAAEQAAAEAAAEQAAAAKEAAPAKKPAKKVAAKTAPKKKVAAKTEKAPSGGVTDPFGDTPAPKKKTEKSGGGGVVDPF